MARPREQTYDDGFFSRIDTEAKAYWLGFVMCDGSLAKRSPNIRLKVTAAEEDLGHLAALTRAVQFKGPLRRSVKAYMPNAQPVWDMILSGRKIVDDLERLGMSIGDKASNGWPDVGQDGFRHFVRGVMDADGSWGVYVEPRGQSRKLKLLVQLTTTRTIAKRIGQAFAAVAGCSMPAMQTGNCANPGIAAWSISGRGNMQRIANYLYRDATVFLERKRASAHKAWTETLNYVRTHHPCQFA